MNNIRLGVRSMPVEAAGNRPRPAAIGLARDFTVDLATLFGALFVAIYLRHQVPIDSAAPGTVHWYAPEVIIAIAGSLCAVFAAGFAVRGALSPSAVRFLTPLVAAGIAFVALLVAVPGMPDLQKLYFAGAALLLILLVVPFPVRSGSIDDRPGLAESVAGVWKNRELLRIWVTYNVRSRYTQAVLGVAWIILLPLSTAFIMSLVFADLLHLAKIGVPFIAFFLAAMVPWGLFNQSVAAGMRSIVTAMGLINQIYFPREIIVLSSLGEALVDTAFMFVAMLVINAIVGVYPNVLFAALPVLFLIELGLTLGLMLLLSWLSAIVRDVPQLVTVLLQMLFYLTPIIYPLQIVPAHVRYLLMINPLTPLVQSFRAIVVYNTPPDWSTLVYPAALAVGLLVFGYRSFKSNEDYLADLV